jgi:hypothetical protein
MDDTSDLFPSLFFLPLWSQKSHIGTQHNILKLTFSQIFKIKNYTFKTKRVGNPGQNCLNRTTEAIISTDGLYVSSIFSRTNIYAEKGFAITGKHARADSFPGTIIYYYEVKLLSKSYSL